MLGDTPFYLLYGRDPILPYDLKYGITSVSRNLNNNPANYKINLLKSLRDSYNKLIFKKENEQRKYKEYYDKGQKDVEFKIGDLVIVHRHVPVRNLSYKLLPKWLGPFQIESRLSSVTYRVMNPENKKSMIVHVQRIIKYKGSYEFWGY